MISSERKGQIKEKLIRHLGKGRQGALTGKTLAYLFESDSDGQDRHLRMIIGELIEEGYPIASTTESPAGFFIAQTAQEVKRYAQTLRSRLIKDAVRRRDFLRAARPILKPEQMKMEV